MAVFKYLDPGERGENISTFPYKISCHSSQQSTLPTRTSPDLIHWILPPHSYISALKPIIHWCNLSEINHCCYFSVLFRNYYQHETTTASDKSMQLQYLDNIFSPHVYNNSDELVLKLNAVESTCAVEFYTVVDTSRSPAHNIPCLLH
ncbi:unnamed protein product [Porites lobata]|uniref:Uncharacterized protein n=1 Tax=Porites lobata TaxID=104759 RepID=A0ABN8PF54_9CNID|nr:unnamed protein product [Porites lobata]